MYDTLKIALGGAFAGCAIMGFLLIYTKILKRLIGDKRGNAKRSAETIRGRLSDQHCRGFRVRMAGGKRRGKEKK